MHKFKVGVGPHAPQLAIQAHDLTLKECQLVRGIVTNQYMPSDDYKHSKACGAFLQGYEEPHNSNSEWDSGGWVLVEFWSSDRPAIERFVAYVNAQLEEQVNG